MRRDVLIALVLFALALGQNVSHVDSTRFHRDEARWIHRARFVRELRDPLGSYWHDRELTRGQPPLGSYLMGLGLLAQGHDLETNGLWNFHFGDAWNRRHGRMPTEADLTAARRTDGVVGALIVVVAYFIGRRLAGRGAGVVAGLMLIPNSLAIYLGSLAGSDALLTLLVALAALVAIGLADRPTWPRALLLGVLLGLGGATKLSPLVLAVPLAGLGLLLLGRAWWERRRGAAVPLPLLGWQLLTLPAVAFATFVAVYPYLWPDPVGRTLVLFRFRAQEMANQGEIWENLAVMSRADALGRVGRWLGEIHSSTGWLGERIANVFGIPWHPSGIDLPLALIGAGVLVGLVVRNGPSSRHTLAALVLGGQVALVVGGMRADFERYMLPVLLAVAVCAGLAVDAAWPHLLRLAAWARADAGLRALVGLDPVPSRRGVGAGVGARRRPLRRLPARRTAPLAPALDGRAPAVVGAASDGLGAAA